MLGVTTISHSFQSWRLPNQGTNLTFQEARRGKGLEPCVRSQDLPFCLAEEAFQVGRSPPLSSVR
jgi:hypothetical protein